MTEIYFDKEKSGKKVTSLNNGATIVDFYTGNKVSVANKGNEYILTGWYSTSGVEFATKKIYQIANNNYDAVDINLNFSISDNKYSNITDQDAQNVVNELLNYDQRIYENNLLCARFADKLTEGQKKDLYKLQFNLAQRNSAVENGSGMLTNFTTDDPEGYYVYKNNLTQFMENYGKVGFPLTLTVILIISAVVIVGSGVATYFAYKSYRDEAKNDVKYSDALTKSLVEKLTDEEFEQLKNETAGLISKAILKERLGNIGSNIKKYLYIGAGILAVYAALKFLPKNNE